MAKPSLLKLIKSSQMFSSLSDAVLKSMLAKCKTISLKSDQILFQQGQSSDYLYIIIEGKIATFSTNVEGKAHLMSEYLPGSVIGEFSAISHEPRSLTAKAAKPTKLLKLANTEFEKLCEKYNKLALEVVKESISKSRNFINVIEGNGVHKQHLVIIPINSHIDFSLFKKEFLKYKKQYSNIVVLTETDETEDELFEKVLEYDKKNITVLYLIESFKSTLAKVCFDLERVDMIYLVAMNNSKAPAISKSVNLILENNKYKCCPELILLHPDKNVVPENTLKWIKLAKFNMHHHIGIHDKNDFQRLLRFMTGNAVGVVLGGGGLRSWAHLGALRAMVELNIPIDTICGTSAGSIVAAHFVMTQSVDDPSDLRKLSAIARKVTSISNLTWPAISIFNGKQYTKTLQKIFGKVQAENLWIPCFFISTNLSKNKEMVYQTGPLWKIIRSSTSIPLIIPPVINSGDICLDGGLMNNLPVDIMKKRIFKSTVIAVELTQLKEDDTKYNFPPILPLWQTMLAKAGILHKNYDFPQLIETFLKALIVGSSLKQRNNANHADILISPDLSNYGLLDVSREDEDKLIEIGYKEAMKVLKNINKKKTISSEEE